jgi:hypothetical protein
MKIVSENINEKFDDTTDPVKDMHIGGIDLQKIFQDTVGKGIREWYERLHDLDLLQKKVTFTDLNTGQEITMVLDDIKRGQMPNEIFFYSKKKIRHRLDIKNKLYIHE